MLWSLDSCQKSMPRPVSHDCSAGSSALLIEMKCFKVMCWPVVGFN